MPKSYIFLLISLFAFSKVSAQVDEDNYEEEEQYEEEEEFQFDKVFFVGTNFQLGFPQGILGRNIEYVGWGAGGNIMWQTKNRNIFLGLDFGYQNSDFEAEIELNTFNENIETRTKNSMVLGHFQIRYYPNTAFKVQPFVEGMIGTKAFLTRTVIKNRTNGSNETLNSDFEKADFAWSFGGAVGFEIPLMKNYLFLEGKCSYLKGTTAEYYARRDGNPIYSFPLEAFEIKKTFTDLFVPQIGVKFMVGLGGDDEEDYYDEEY